MGLVLPYPTMKKINRQATAFRFEEKFLTQLRAASGATGLTITAVVERCVDAHLDKLIKEMDSERQAAAKELLNLRKRK